MMTTQEIRVNDLMSKVRFTPAFGKYVVSQWAKSSGKGSSPFYWEFEPVDLTFQRAVERDFLKAMLLPDPVARLQWLASVAVFRRPEPPAGRGDDGYPGVARHYCDMVYEATPYLQEMVAKDPEMKQFMSRFKRHDCLYFSLPHRESNDKNWRSLMTRITGPFFYHEVEEWKWVNLKLVGLKI